MIWRVWMKKDKTPFSKMRQKYDKNMSWVRYIPQTYFPTNNYIHVIRACSVYILLVLLPIYYSWPQGVFTKAHTLCFNSGMDLYRFASELLVGRWSRGSTYTFSPYSQPKPTYPKILGRLDICHFLHYSARSGKWYFLKDIIIVTQLPGCRCDHNWGSVE